MTDQTYQVLFHRQTGECPGKWDGDLWGKVCALNIDHFRPESSAHRPLTQCKMAYSADSIRGIFRVEDRYVRCVHTDFQSEVYKDSCVEFFVQPKAAGGYFNFEFNCGGAMLATYVTDPTRINGHVLGCSPLSPHDNIMITRASSLSQIVEPEITTPVTWFLEFIIPITVLETYTGMLRNISRQTWRANFYKCANETSHPHWSSWAPVKELNFHDPDNFGSLQFTSKINYLSPQEETGRR
jgi:hypothetical protein